MVIKIAIPNNYVKGILRKTYKIEDFTRQRLKAPHPGTEVGHTQRSTY
jgi:hypothetical protein